MYTYGITGTSINEFQDVDLSGIADNDLLQYDSASGTWQPVAASTVAGAAQLDDLSDVTITELAEWPGPAPILFGAGAPSAGTGVDGDFYLDISAPPAYVLYGPKTAGAWALAGVSGTFGTDFVFGTQLPVGPNPGTSPAPYHLYTPAGTPLGVYGPYNANGLSTRTPLVYDHASAAWVESTGRFLTDTNGGGAKVSLQSVSGDVFIFPETASEFRITMTGNISLAPAATAGVFGPVRQTPNSRIANIRIHLQQDATGGRTVTAWPSNIVWQNGYAPVINTIANATTSFEFTTTDNGNNWLGRELTEPTWPVSVKTAAYTFAAVDRNSTVVLNSASNFDFTVPLNSATAFPIGTRILVATQSTGHITVVGDTGVTVTGTTTLNTAGHIATLIKVDTDTWLCYR